MAMISVGSDGAVLIAVKAVPGGEARRGGGGAGRTPESPREPAARGREGEQGDLRADRA